MTESQVNGISVTATHFSPEGKVLNQPKIEQPKPEGRVAAFIRNLRKQELPKQPNGPKHVLESLQQLGIDKRAEIVMTQISEIVESGAKYEMATRGFLGIYGGYEVQVDNFAQAQAKRERIPTNEARPLVETPVELTNLINELSPKDTTVSDRIVSLIIGRSDILLRTAENINFHLYLPDSQKPLEDPTNFLHLGITAYRPHTESTSALKSVEESLQNKEKLLNITDAVITYTERVATVLPGQIKLTIQEEEAERQRGEQERDASSPTTETIKHEITKSLKEKLKQRHPDNPLFKDKVVCPTGWVRLEHLTSEVRLDKLGQEGLKPQRGSRDDPVENALDQVAQEYGKGEFSRKKIVFAYVDAEEQVKEYTAYSGMGSHDTLTPEQIEAGYTQEPVLLEVYIDPDKAIVADSARVAYSLKPLIKPEDFRNMAKNYWGDTCILREYLDFMKLSPLEKLSDDKPAARISMPEVLIAGGIQPEYIRFERILSKKEPDDE